MDLAKSHGTGESWCETSAEYRTELTNTPITHAEMVSFLDMLIGMGLYPKGYRVFFGRDNDRRWGHASYHKKEIIINRRCVQIFLHEVAHITTHDVHKDKEAHGKTFGNVLDGFVILWKQGNRK